MRGVAGLVHEVACHDHERGLETVDGGDGKFGVRRVLHEVDVVVGETELRIAQLDEEEAAVRNGLRARTAAPFLGGQTQGEKQERKGESVKPFHPFPVELKVNVTF